MEDIEIALNAKIKPIIDIAKKLDLSPNDLELYGQYKAKIKKRSDKKDSKLILVTGISPTQFGEGKSTVTIGLGDALSRLGKKVCIALREPSLGPVMGMKGGACGGGYSQVIPMEDINLHFTGDFHALTSANNLVSALIDNHIYQGNDLNIDPKRILFKRVLDVNDRSLRSILVGIGENNGTIRQDGFDITVASELMAILCLSKDDNDFKERISNILLAYTFDNKPIFLKDLSCVDAIYLLMKDALKPNLVQTLEGTPSLVHGGPFANIAHGCNSLIATTTALSLADYVVTEAGFGSDLGMEKFLDIKSRVGNLKPNAVVIVCTIRALKLNGGMKSKDVTTPNLDYLKIGISNLIKHIKNVQNFNLTPIVAINRFSFDSEDELNYVIDCVKNMEVKVEITTSYENGSSGAINLANSLLDSLSNNDINYVYNLTDSLEDKIKKVAVKVYGAKDIELSDLAKKKINDLKKSSYFNLDDFYICIAKTQYSFSHDPKLIGAPKDFIFKIKDLVINSGTKFIVLLAGDIIRMPGLPKVPAACKIKCLDDKIEGLF